MKIASETDRPLRLILPKKGRLQEDCATAMETAGLDVLRAGPRLDYGILLDKHGDLPAAEILLQRADDALMTLQEDAADLALVGADCLAEFRSTREGGAKLRLRSHFNEISPCRLMIAARPEAQIGNPAALSGWRVATSYPGLLKNWLVFHGVEGVDVRERRGGLEDCVRLGIADAIFDVRQSGASLRANGLHEKITIMESSAVLVQAAGPLAGTDAFAQALTERLGKAGAHIPAPRSLARVPA